MKKAAVIGYPVMHSLSPRLHSYWLKYYGIAGEYGFLEASPADLPGVIKALAAKGYAGANVTVPHKETVMAYIDNYTDLAARVGAVNTLVIGPDGKISGDNTDVFGFVENIRKNAPDFRFAGTVAVVLGAGGAAKGVVAGLIDEGAERVILVNRTQEKAEQIAKHYLRKVTVSSWEDRHAVLQEAQLLVNTTTLGMKGQPPLEISLDKLPMNALVADVVYKPLETALLRDAGMRGNKVVDGLGMLLYQAVPGFEAWFGVRPVVTDTLRNYVLEAAV